MPIAFQSDGVPSGNPRKFRHFTLWNLGGLVLQDDADAPETLLLQFQARDERIEGSSQKTENKAR